MQLPRLNASGESMITLDKPNLPHSSANLGLKMTASGSSLVRANADTAETRATPLGQQV